MLYFSTPYFLRMKKFYLILFAGVLLQTGKAQYCFNTSNYFGTGGATEAIITSDFNHDGVADLVTSGGGNVRIATGNGDGTFSSFTSYAVGASASALCAVDLNKDGNMDVVSANTGTNDLTVLLNNGTATFTTSITVPVGNQPAGICTADFDGDGNPDLAVTCVSPDQIYVLLGTGTGNFATNTTPSVSPYGICSGDFNGDSKADLAATDNTNGVLMIYTGVGNGTFIGPVSYGVGNNPRCVITTDYNTDGKTDLCVVNRSSSNIMVLTNNGTGTFSLAQTMVTSTEPTWVTETNLNGDAIPDYATSDYGVMMPPFFFSVMVNGSSNSMGAGGGMSPHGICSADFNGDGKKDIALACEGTNNVGIYLNTLPMPHISGTNQICPGSSTTLTASGASTYTWSSNAGNATTPTVTVSPTSTQNYTVTASAAGCGNTAQSVITVTVNPSPSITPLFQSGSSSICSGQSATIACYGDADYCTWMPGSLTGTLVTVSPTTTTNYTITGTNTSTGCSITGTIGLNVNATPTVTINSSATTVCSGTSVTLSGNGATTYSWSGGVSNGTPFTPVSTGTYVVTGTSPGPCTNTTSVVITVNASPTLTIGANPSSICAGSTSVLSGSGALSYVWSSNAGSTTTNTVLVNPSSTAVYTLTGNNGNGCSSSATTTLTVNPLPTVTASSSATGAVCAGTSITLTAAGTATTYTWTGGITNGVAFPAVAQTYTVTGIDANNCSNTATITVNASTAFAPNICTVTVDSLSINNVITWDKTLYQNADTFYIYRDTANNNFAQIAALPYSALSQYLDTARSIGQVNGDPNVTTYHYKLAYRDSCGNMSPMSPYHGSIYQYNIGSLFIWNAYQIEGQPTPVPGLSSYSLKRDNLGNTGNFITAASAGASSTSINDPQYGTYQLVADWRVETNWSVVCIPTFRQAGGNQQPLGQVVKSKSNITNNRGTTGVKLIDKLFNVYPNPTNGVLKLDFNYNVAGKFSVKVLSAIGQEVFSADFEAAMQHQQIDLTHLPEGIYLLQVNTPGGISVKRIVKN